MSEIDRLRGPSGDEPPAGRQTFDRVVIDALPRAVVVTDDSGRVILWNAAAEQLYGWAEREVLGRSVLDVLAPVEDLATNCEDLDFVAAGNEMSGDRTVIHRDGRPLRVTTFTRPVVDENGCPVAIVGMSEDLVAVRRAEQAARDLGEHFRLALQAGGLGTWRWDMASGTTMWDERLEALFGLAPGEFDETFETYVSLLHPDDREDVLKHVQEAVETRRPYRVEHRVVWRDGSIHWVVGAGGVTVDERGEVTGTIGCVMDVTDRVLEEQERQRLATVAVEAAESERLQRARLEFLSAVNDALNASSNVDDVMRNVVNAAVPRLGDWCSIHVLDDQGARSPRVEIAHVDPNLVAYAHQLQERFPYDPDASTGVPHVIRTGETVFYPDITEQVITDLNATPEEREIIGQLSLRSAIAVPLVKRGRILGAMQFVLANSSRRYTDDDVALARVVAGRIASSLDNLRLNARQRLISQTLQRSLLPASLPAIPGIDVAVRYWPAGEASEVGGDFYDIFALEAAGQWAVVMGDVCGTGPTAAALTGLARHSIRGSAWHGDDPVEVLTALHRAVQRSETGSFLTAVYATLDTSTERPQLTVTCGGHPMPIRTSRDGTSTVVGVPGTLLGWLDDLTFRPVTTPLDDGDIVVFYTDGATDLRPPHCLDPSQFADLVNGACSAGGSVETIADRIHDALTAVLPFDLRHDDIALLVMRVDKR